MKNVSVCSWGKRSNLVVGELQIESSSQEWFEKQDKSGNIEKTALIP